MIAFSDIAVRVARDRLRLAEKEHRSALKAWTKLQPKDGVPERRTEIRLVQEKVAAHFGLTPESLWGLARDDTTAKARHMAIALLHRTTRVHKLEIIAAFNRTRALFTFALRAHDQRCATDEDYRKSYDSLFKDLTP